MKRIAASLFLLLASVAVQADAIYSCKDASGRPYYTANPPADRGVTCKPMAKSIQPSSDAPAERQAFAERQMADRQQRKKADEAAAKADKEKADAAEKSKQCERARANLQGIESGQARFTTDANGERVGLDGAVRDQELENARKAVDSWCN